MIYDMYNMYGIFKIMLKLKKAYNIIWYDML